MQEILFYLWLELVVELAVESNHAWPPRASYGVHDELLILPNPSVTSLVLCLARS
jgi:hypothetical protein